MTEQWNAQLGNKNDAEYTAFLERLSARYVSIASQQPVFKTENTGRWEAYLQTFAPADRQAHNCQACHHFINRFGGLVTIDPATGKTTAAFWDPELAPANYQPAVRMLKKLVEQAKVTAPFYASEARFGKAHTGNWTHLYADNPKQHVNPLQTAPQTMALRRQDYQKLRRAVSEYSASVAAKVVQMLQAGTLPRSDKYLPMAEVFLRLRQDVDMHMHLKTKNNLMWLAVAQASGGVVSDALDVLLDGVTKGSSFEKIKGVWSSVTDERTYQQKQTAPAAGNISQAEKAVEALGIAPAFARRYTRIEDLEPGWVWTPSETVREHVARVAPKAGVFEHLKKEQEVAVPDLDIPAKRVTWEKFANSVLPSAAIVEYRVPLVGRFCALTTAADPDAPPILRWDSLTQRNTVAWSFPSPAASASNWGLQAGMLVPVQAIVNSPNQWGREEVASDKGAFLLLEGAKDTRDVPGGGLFIEHVRSDLQPYRSTIQAHLNKLKVQGADAPDLMAFGIGYMAGGQFTELAAPKPAQGLLAGKAPDKIHVILVLDNSGSMREHLHAGRAAAASLAAAVQVMPGNVDVTAIIFGSHAITVCTRDHKSGLLGIEQRITGGGGGTTLNDTLANTLLTAMQWPDAGSPDTAFFLGIMTDGRDEGSKRYRPYEVFELVRQAQATGRWTIAFAGAAAYGYAPAEYARSIGIPEGNVKVFANTDQGFEDAGVAYASSTQTLASGYAGGARASASFFSATSTHRELGKAFPVFVVTDKSGVKSVYEIDRWD